MSDSNISLPMSPTARLGVSGLPSLTDTMVAGGLYALVAETPPARFPILANSLGHALDVGMPCTVIVPTDPKSFIQRIESFGTSCGPSAQGGRQPRFFTMQDEFAKKMFQFGADSFVQELELFEVLPNSYLVFDQADELLSLHDITLASDQVDTLRKWCQQRRVTLLLAFSRATAAEIGTLNALMDNLTGMARLGADKDGLELTFDYWQSQEGTIAARNFRLLTLDSGLYEATLKVAQMEPSEDGRRQFAEETNTQTDPSYFYMDPDLGSMAKQMRGNWQQVDTLLGMLHATRTTRGATCVLTYQRDSSLRQLAETVHTLRLSLGRQARIVVQEKNASLRYQNEALLLRLGVNLVVNRDVPPSRLPLLLDALVGQVFTRDVDINFEAALTSVLPTHLRGYLLPLRFVREVRTVLGEGETLNIPSAMIVGRPRPEVSIIDILTNIGLSRPGDLISTDNEYCYLFLNACPQSVMLLTLDRILGGPADTIFEDLRFLVKREEIQAELDALSHAAATQVLPDYSTMLVSAKGPNPGVTEAEPDNAAMAPPMALPAEANELRPTKAIFAQGAAEPPRVKATLGGTNAAPDLKPEKTLQPYGHSAAVIPIGRGVAPRATRSQSGKGDPATNVNPVG